MPETAQTWQAEALIDGFSPLSVERLTLRYSIALLQFCQRNLLRRLGVTGAAPVLARRGLLKENLMKIRTSALSNGTPKRMYLAIAAIVLALLAIPHAAHSQGIVRGAEDGYRQGGRAAGPVGAVVGGAVGAGVGGAMGAVKGVFGIPNGGGRCRGYYDRRHRFHCYR